MSPLQIGGGGVDPFGVATTEALGRAAGFLLTAAIVYLAGRLVVTPAVVRIVRARNRDNPTIQSATETYLHALVVTVATLAGVAGAGLGGLLTNTAIVVAALTLVVGVAGQEVIGSLVSGLFLVADPEFNVGDWISWSGGEGVVEAVDFRVTRVRTLNNETMTVPNTELTTNTLTRPYGREQYRVTEQVDVAYEDDVELALMTLAAVGDDDDRILSDPAPTARIHAFGSDAIALQVEFWIADPANVDLVDVRSAFRRRVKRRFDEEGVTLGPPSGREVSGRLSVAVSPDAAGSD